jgi:hypothetical protein
MLNVVASDAMPRTTLDLDPSVLAELRRRATAERKSIGRVASELLAQQLDPTTSSPRDYSFDWISRELGTPRIDLEDKEGVRSLLDSS